MRQMESHQGLDLAELIRTHDTPLSALKAYAQQQGGESHELIALQEGVLTEIGDRQEYMRFVYRLCLEQDNCATLGED